MRRLLLLLSLLCVPQCWALDEAELAAKLSSEANEFLASLLGPSKAKAVVTVEGERSTTQTQTEVMTPISSPDKVDQRSMPGYTNEEENKKRIEYTQKDQENTQRTSGLIIRRLRVAVVLDTGLAEAQINAVRRLLPDLLHMDTNRGDELSVLRVQLMTPWRSALLSPEGLRLSALFGGAAALLIVISFFAYLTALRMTRVFAAEFARRPAGGGAIEGQAAPQMVAAPMILPGGIPSLTEPQGAQEPGAVPALGQRFDFLTSRPAEELVRVLAKEPAEDLALLFGYLAQSNPDQATAIFALLEPALQSRVSAGLARLTLADPERLAILENRLKNSVEFGVRGTERLGRILSRLPMEERQGLLGELMSGSPEQGSEVERSIFPFEGIAELRPNHLRRLILAVPYQDWGVALRGAPENLVNRVLEELLGGTRELVREAMDAPQPRAKIIEARSRVLSSAYALAARGEVVLGGEGASAEMI